MGIKVPVETELFLVYVEEYNADSDYSNNCILDDAAKLENITHVVFGFFLHSRSKQIAITCERC